MKKSVFIAAAIVSISAPVYAHHPLGGMPMETFSDGMLSGIGHPLLGFDHLFFVVLVGIAAAYTGFQRMLPLAYIAAMAVGCLMMSQGIDLPFKELVIALSLVGVGSFVLSGKALGAPIAAALFALFGLFHGSAFGDSIAAQETTAGASVLIGYLLGLAVLQYMISLASGLAMRRLWKALDSTAMAPRLAGAAVAGVGVYMTLENLEGALLATPGLGI